MRVFLKFILISIINFLDKLLFTEILNIMIKQNTGHDDFLKECKMAFDIFDVNKNGKIGRNDIKYMMEIIREDCNEITIDVILQFFCKAKNGFINFK